MAVALTFLITILAPQALGLIFMYPQPDISKRCQAVGYVLSAYMLYLGATASLMPSGYLPYILPLFGHLNANDLGILINLTGGLMLAVWVGYAMRAGKP